MSPFNPAVHTEFGLLTELSHNGAAVTVRYYCTPGDGIVLLAVETHGRADRCILDDLTNQKVDEFRTKCALQQEALRVEQLATV